MASRDDNVIIGIPELYKMIEKINEKIELSDKENRERDARNQNEIRMWIKGNGKKGLQDRIVAVETKLYIGISILTVIVGKVILELIS